MAKNTYRNTPVPKASPSVTVKSSTKPKKNIPNTGIFNWAKKLVIKLTKYFLILSIGGVVIFKFIPIPFTWTMMNEKIGSIIDGEDSEIHYTWKSYNNVSREMHLAAVAAEDQLFPEHLGLDFSAMSNAFNSNLKGKKIRGASTISQQTAKNVFLWQGRSYIRKIFEAYFTVLIEVIWGKERILEVYVNVAEMGKNTFGAEAAAQKYFNKSANNLSRNEAAKLAVVLPSPKKWSVSKPGPYVAQRVPRIANQMRALGGTAYIKGLRSF